LKIAFASGKGGTGKTTLATNMAASIAANAKHVTYADCDVEEPNGHIFVSPDVTEKIDVEVGSPLIDKEKCNLCGVCADVCKFNAIAILGPEPLVFPSLCHSCGACIELCPEKAIAEIPRAIGKIKKGVFRQLNFLSGELNVGEAMAPPVTKALKKHITDDEVIIIDVPPGTSCPVIEAINHSDFVVLVTEPTPFGLNDLELAYEMLMKLNLPFGVVINRSNIGDDQVEKFCHDKKIEILAQLPFSKDIAIAYSNGKLIADSNSNFDDEMQKLFQRITKRINYG
jgi:MinD superfamily P-loop ATPase